MAKMCPQTGKKVVYLQCSECAERSKCRSRKDKRSLFGKTTGLPTAPDATERADGTGNMSAPESLLDTIPELDLT